MPDCSVEVVATSFEKGLPVEQSRRLLQLLFSPLCSERDSEEGGEAPPTPLQQRAPMREKGDQR